MSGKNQTPVTLGINAPTASDLPVNSPGVSWQTTNPAIGFLPLDITSQGQGSPPSGLINGAMTGTGTIYSQIIDVSRMDNIGLEVFWTGTAVGVFSVHGSDSGINFPSITFDPPLAQPAGASGEYLVDLNQFPWKYLMLQYVNTSGTGVLNVYCQLKDLN